MPIFVTRSSMPSMEEYIEELRPVFETRHLTNMGPIHNKLQDSLQEYLGVDHVSLFANGHTALQDAIHALGLRKEGGEVITTPFTFASTTNAIVQNSLKPVFCDIKADDYTMDPDKIEALINENTVAIIPVHVYGNVCDVEKIEGIAKKHGLKVIYDAAHAFGVSYKGRGVSAYGDASMFSFHATKVFHTVEGGCVAYSDDSYTDRLQMCKNFGMLGSEDVIEVSGNAKMDEFRAAMGICNLRHIDEWILDRKTAYDRYVERLENVPGIRVNRYHKDTKPNYAYFPILVDKDLFGMDRDALDAKLREHGVIPRKYFAPAVNEMTAYSGMDDHETPIASETAGKILTLPLFADLTVEMVDQICDIIIG